ncbi:hypothetical protein IMZ11_36730 [Microtetraspora sp. AC03309]|uniref:hypothetical protein n=1 Tax=Microtetraspora sp. AC03309 TaxID=2779376 RepID=UPI001E4F1F00|nr:hypothetical protein [Microtetraspora sp. AC03309]MCC5581169.1 hypothetical protein [Microtetraspora sp. AC03309]
MNGNKRSLVIGALIGMVAGGSGIAVAGAVADSETITACVSTNGTLRIPAGDSPTGSSDQGARGALPVPTSTTAPRGCLDGERTISWNQTGPVGPQGAQGGTGPAGPKGEPGISGREIVKTRGVFAAHATNMVEVACPQGKTPINASYVAGYAAGPGFVDQMQVGYWGPLYDEGTWFYRATNPLDVPVAVQVTVMCAVLS